MDLMQQWFKLFSLTSDTESEEDDLNTAVLSGLYDLVFSHFIKIYLKESIHLLRYVCLPIRKQALRVKT